MTSIPGEWLCLPRALLLLHRGEFPRPGQRPRQAVNCNSPHPERAESSVPTPGPRDGGQRVAPCPGARGLGESKARAVGPGLTDGMRSRRGDGLVRPVASAGRIHVRAPGSRRCPRPTAFSSRGGPKFCRAFGAVQVLKRAGMRRWWSGDATVGRQPQMKVLNGCRPPWWRRVEDRSVTAVNAEVHWAWAGRLGGGSAGWSLRCSGSSFPSQRLQGWRNFEPREPRAVWMQEGRIAGMRGELPGMPRLGSRVGPTGFCLSPGRGRSYIAAPCRTCLRDPSMLRRVIARCTGFRCGIRLRRRCIMRGWPRWV